VRSVANSRVRWATVIENVLKMTNAPTNSAMPANVSRKYRMIDVNWPISSSASSASTLADWTVVPAGSTDAIASTSSSSVVPSFAATEIASY
jgi:hypothetical protein